MLKQHGLKFIHGDPEMEFIRENPHATQDAIAMITCDIVSSNPVGQVYYPLLHHITLPSVVSHISTMYEPNNLVFHRCYNAFIYDIKFTFLKINGNEHDFYCCYDDLPITITLAFRSEK